MLGFPEFIKATQKAQFADFSAHATTRVADAEAFVEMQQYILKRYADLQVVASFLVDTQVFDCVVIQTDTTTTSQPAGHLQFPAGSIPMRRITLEELIRFQTVRSFLKKLPE